MTGPPALDADQLQKINEAKAKALAKKAEKTSLKTNAPK
jgi:hypothetical protein